MAELIHEIEIGDSTVIMKKYPNLHMIEICEIRNKIKKNEQFIRLYNDREEEDFTVALEYFDGLISWIEKGRNGQILPYDYKDGS